MATIRQLEPTLRKPPRALLCIHGAGGSAAIFRVQLAKLRFALRHDFELVFATAPFVSGAGPGVLPLFEGMEPFYSWFQQDPTRQDAGEQDDNKGEEEKQRMATTQSPSIEKRVQAVQAPIRQAVENWQYTNPETPIVGIVAFSEGALVATLLLWQQKMGRVPWLPTMNIAMFVCSYYREEATEFMRAESAHNDTKILINVPTLHLQGRQDFAREGSKKLVGWHFLPRFAHVLEFQGQHQFPNRRADVEETIKRFLQLHEKEKTAGLY